MGETVHWKTASGSRSVFLISIFVFKQIRGFLSCMLLWILISKTTTKSVLFYFLFLVFSGYWQNKHWSLHDTFLTKFCFHVHCEHHKWRLIRFPHGFRANQVFSCRTVKKRRDFIVCVCNKYVLCWSQYFKEFFLILESAYVYQINVLYSRVFWGITVQPSRDMIKVSSKTPIEQLSSLRHRVYMYSDFSWG